MRTGNAVETTSSQVEATLLVSMSITISETTRIADSRADRIDDDEIDEIDEIDRAESSVRVDDNKVSTIGEDIAAVHF